MLREVFLQRLPVLGQGALGLMPQTEVEARETAFTIFVEVALDGASGDIGECGDLVVAEAVALEPKNLHLALDAWVGVVIPIVGQGSAVFGGEVDRSHGGSSR
jgi:hypothetical protein